MTNPPNTRGALGSQPTLMAPTETEVLRRALRAKLQESSDRVRADFAADGWTLERLEAEGARLKAQERAVGRAIGARRRRAVNP